MWEERFKLARWPSNTGHFPSDARVCEVFASTLKTLAVQQQPAWSLWKVSQLMHRARGAQSWCHVQLRHPQACVTTGALRCLCHLSLLGEHQLQLTDSTAPYQPACMHAHPVYFGTTSNYFKCLSILCLKEKPAFDLEAAGFLPLVVPYKWHSCALGCLSSQSKEIVLSDSSHWISFCLDHPCVRSSLLSCACSYTANLACSGTWTQTAHNTPTAVCINNTAHKTACV